MPKIDLKSYLHQLIDAEHQAAKNMTENRYIDPEMVESEFKSKHDIVDAVLQKAEDDAVTTAILNEIKRFLEGSIRALQAETPRTDAHLTAIGTYQTVLNRIDELEKVADSIESE